MHPDPVEPASPRLESLGTESPEGLRHLGSEASTLDASSSLENLLAGTAAPRAPKGPNTSPPSAQPPMPKKSHEHLDPKESRRRHAPESHEHLELREPLAHPPSTPAAPLALSPSGANAPKGVHAFHPRNRWCLRTRGPQRRRLGEPQRIRIPKNAWHIALDEDHRLKKPQPPSPRASGASAPEGASEPLTLELEHREPEARGVSTSRCLAPESARHVSPSVLPARAPDVPEDPEGSPHDSASPNGAKRPAPRRAPASWIQGQSHDAPKTVRDRPRDLRHQTPEDP